MIRNDHRHRTVNALIFCLMFHKLSEKKSNIRQLTDPYSLNRRMCFIFHYLVQIRVLLMEETFNDRVVRLKITEKSS